MKKIVALLLASVLVLSLSACAGSSAPETVVAENTTETKVAETEVSETESSYDEKKENSLVVWLPPQTAGDTFDFEFWAEVFEPWEEENNCKIDLTIVPWGNYEEKYLTGFSSGEGPDVGYMYNEMLYDYVDLGQIEVLDNYLTEEDKEEFLLLDLGKINGKQYTMPLFPGGARVLFYNEDILSAAGIDVPHTWDEFISACQAVKASNPDVVPFAQCWGSEAIGVLNTSYYPFLWQAGGSIMDFDGTVTLMDNSAGVDAAQFLYDLMYKYEVMPTDCIGWSEEDCQGMLQNGTLAFYVDLLNRKDTIFSAAECGTNISFIPQLGKTNPDEWKSMSTADALILNASSENKELGWSLIKYIESPVVMERVHAELCNCPALTKSEKSSLSEEDSAIYSSGKLEALPVAKGSNAVMANLKSNMQLMLMDEMTPEEAIQATVDYSKTLN